MFSTSGDILNLVLAICLILLTFFLSWAMYYFVAGIKKIHHLIKRADSGVTKVEEVIDMAKDKLKNSATYFMILGEIAKKAMEFVQERRDKKSASRKK